MTTTIKWRCGEPIQAPTTLQRRAEQFDGDYYTIGQTTQEMDIGCAACSKTTKHRVTLVR